MGNFFSCVQRVLPSSRLLYLFGAFLFLAKNYMKVEA